MTATDELRKLLDECGVEWWAEDDPEEPAYYFVTKWFANACEQTYEEIPAIRSRSLKAYCVTPEQAIAATLGSHERTAKMYRDEHGIWHCAACERGADVIAGNDGELDSWIDSWAPNYCPYCGRRGEQ